MNLRSQALKRRSKRKLRRPPRPLPPDAQALRYFGALRRMLGYIRTRVESQLLPILPELVDRARVDSLHTDAMDPSKRVNKLLDRISEAFYRTWDPAEMAGITKLVGKSTTEWGAAQLRRQLGAQLGFDPTTVLPGGAARLNAFAERNVMLITKMSDDLMNQIRQTVVLGVQNGTRHEEIAEDIEERFGVGEARAKVIARTETQKLMSDTNQARLEELGVDRYVWRCVNDERVRDVHEDFDGHVYSWDDPPGDGSAAEGTHPGTAVNCRCYAEAVIEELGDTRPAEEGSRPDEPATAEEGSRPDEPDESES